MYVIREVLSCKPGKVRQMVEKFRGISAVLKEMGQEPLRVLTDVTGEPYWTIIAEASVEKIARLSRAADVNVTTALYSLQRYYGPLRERNQNRADVPREEREVVWPGSCSA